MKQVIAGLLFLIFSFTCFPFEEKAPPVCRSEVRSLGGSVEGNSLAEGSERPSECITPELSLDLGGGVKLELVLIPAGKFVMGEVCHDPPIPAIVLAAPFLILSVLLVALAIWSRIKRTRFRFSLKLLVVLTVLTGLAQWGIVSLYHIHKKIEMGHDYIAWEDLVGRNPAHEVAIERSFYMGIYEVTQEQYQQVMSDNPSHFRGDEKLPVEMVSWDDASKFCAKLSTQVKMNVRLPTEAEWEYACRAGTRTIYYSGDEDILTDVAWIDINSHHKTHPVGFKKKNPWGLYDMHGNVWEWCADNYGPFSSAESYDEPPGSERCFRGGSWYNSASSCRSAFRARSAPDQRAFHSGFRIVVDPVVADQRAAPPSKPQ